MRGRIIWLIAVVLLFGVDTAFAQMGYPYSPQPQSNTSTNANANTTKTVQKKSEPAVAPYKDLNPGALIHIESRISKAAFLVGEELALDLEISFPSTITIIEEDINPKKITLLPFEVKDGTITESQFGELKVLHCHYVLKNLDIRKPETRTIEQFVIHYALLEPGKTEQQLDKKEYKVEKIPVEWRSTLPKEAYDIRDKFELNAFKYRAIILIATAGILLLLFVGWRFVATIRAFGKIAVVKTKKPRFPGMWRGAWMARAKLMIIRIKLSKLKEPDVLDQLESQSYDIALKFLSESVFKSKDKKTPEDVMMALEGNKHRLIHLIWARNLVGFCSEIQRFHYQDKNVPEFKKILNQMIECLKYFGPWCVIRHLRDFFRRKL